jgi:large subunit ribosomal protein L18e
VFLTLSLNIDLINFIGTNTLLLRASKKREALTHFGPGAGIKGSHTKPYVRSRGNKFERGRKL